MTVLPCFHIALLFPFVVTLSTFATLSVNSAKGLSLGREMLRCAQHDKAALSMTRLRSAWQCKDDRAAALSHRPRTM